MCWMNNLEMDYLWAIKCIFILHSDPYYLLFIYVALLVNLEGLVNTTFVTFRTNTDLNLLATFLSGLICSVAMELALSLEKLTNEKLLNVHAVSSSAMLVDCIIVHLDIF